MFFVTNAKRASGSIVCAAVCVSACATTNRVLHPAPPTHYVQIAEALSAPTLSERIRVAPHQFSDSQRIDACRTPVAVQRLDVAPPILDLATGNRYDLSSLSVVAVDEAGIAVPDVPLSIEAEETTPSPVQLRSDDSDLAQGRLLAIGAGEFHVRIRALCTLRAAEKVILARVTP